MGLLNLIGPCHNLTKGLETRAITRFESFPTRRAVTRVGQQRTGFAGTNRLCAHLEMTYLTCRSLDSFHNFFFRNLSLELSQDWPLLPR